MLGFAGPAPTDMGSDAADPDLPRFINGNLDRAEYLRLREEHIALLRGAEPGRTLDPTARSRAIAQMEHQMAQRNRAAGKANGAPQLAPPLPNWVELGPSPIPNGQTQGGRVTAIEIDPTDPNKVYVGAAQGGVYRSLDGGTTWPRPEITSPPSGCVQMPRVMQPITILRLGLPLFPPPLS
jgi:hypothetical protein